MPYLGNTPSTSFATVVKDSFNGGSTAYTLSKVATTNSVSVFVENVRQEPTTAYAVSGTTLTFTATTPSGTGNIYVLHMNPTTTTTHPAAQNLTAVNGTLTGTLGVTGASTLTGNVALGGTLDMNGAELVLDADADTSITADTDDRIDFKTGGTDRLQVQSTSGKYVVIADGLTLTDGNLIVASGHGIDFSATADTSTSGASMSSELFDYYEEGTWTPTAFGGTTAGSFSATTVAGVYTRIGRIVYCEIRISSGSLSGAAGTMQFGGLPFTIGGTQYGCSGSFAFNTIDFDPSTIPVIQLGSSTQIYFLVSQDDTGWTTLTTSNFDSTFTLIGTFIYQTG